MTTSGFHGFNMNPVELVDAHSTQLFFPEFLLFYKNDWFLKTFIFDNCSLSQEKTGGKHNLPTMQECETIILNNYLKLLGPDRCKDRHIDRQGDYRGDLILKNDFVFRFMNILWLHCGCNMNVLNFKWANFNENHEINIIKKFQLPR